MYEVINGNFVTFTLLFGLTLQLATGKVFEKKVEIFFGAGVATILLLIFTDVLETYYASFETLNNMRYVITIIGYILRPIAVAIFLGILLREKDYFLFLCLPIVIEAILIMTSPFNHIVFYYDQYNHFHRGPLGYLPHIVGIGYLIILGYSAIRKYYNTNVAEMLTVLYNILICTTATILETFFYMKYLLPGAMITSCGVYYIYLYTQIYKFDVLTGLLNRRTFYNDSQKIANYSMVIVSIDLNNLKTLNDKQGHAVGDIAIRSVAKALKSTSENKFRIYRTGGDEFMALGLKQSAKSAENFIEKVKKELEKTTYSASFGYTLYMPDMDFDEACVLADKNMYEDKAQKKAN